MALELSKWGFPLSKSKSFHLVFFKLGEYVGGHNILTKFYNQPYPSGTPELWPLNCPKTELVVSALQVKYPAFQKVVITIEFTTKTTGVVCVSLALLLTILTCTMNKLFPSFTPSNYSVSEVNPS